MDARSQLKKLADLFMKNLDNDKLLELVVPRISQLDIVGSIEIEAEDYDGSESLVRKTLGSRDTSKSYAQLMAIAGLVAEQLHCTLSIIIFRHDDHANFSRIPCLNKSNIIDT
jgi:hypothetical protein